MGLGGGLPKALCITLFLIVSLATIIVGISGQTVSPCASNVLPPSDLAVSVDFCQQVLLTDGLTGYTLWYKRDNSTSPNTLSFVLSVPRDDTRWYGMGFNPSQNVMSGTNAIIFWVDRTSGKPVKDTYYISATNLRGVNADNTRLTYKSPPNVVVETDNLYLTFDVVETTPSDFVNQNFVRSLSGGVPTSGSVITDQSEHEGYSSVKINFETGSAAVTTVNVDGKRRTHGILNIIGWGVLLPIGAIVARYARGFDPHWFYIHAVSQIVGYGFVLAGLITGSKLLDQLPEVDADNHKALGIAVFVLATIQISAVLIRPKKEAKLRRYWNWGHWWLGRAALVIGAVNIFVGIHLADASRKWKLGYAVILALELLTVVILEILLWLNYAKSKDEPNLPQTAMQNRDSNGASAPAPPYETSWDDKP